MLLGLAKNIYITRSIQKRGCYADSDRVCAQTHSRAVYARQAHPDWPFVLLLALSDTDYEMTELTGNEGCRRGRSLQMTRQAEQGLSFALAV